jgi:transcriptional regulator with PAS, ATPase and Fis domain
MSSGDTTVQLEDSECVGKVDLPLRLVCLHGSFAGESVMRNGLVLGRANSCGVVVGGQGVSREHAEFTRQGPLWILRDLGSTNGSYVDGRRVQHAPVGPGSLIRIGESVALVSRHESGTVEAKELVEGLIAGPELAALLEPIKRAATTDLPIVVTGATGTGKERVAQAVHKWSGRSGPYYAINCAAIPAQMAEAELFGYRRGAYTGANQSHDGHLRAAQGGTLFLDEIAELTLEVQAKLLRALEQRAVTPLGESRSYSLEIRVICASQRPLEALVAAGRFREDLCARLSGIIVNLPPLKERRADIISLFRYFLNRECKGDPPDVESKVVEALCLYAWPKNVRELELATRRLVVLNGGNMILKRAHLPAEIVRDVPEDVADEQAAFATRDEQDLHRIVVALRENGGNVKAAAKQAKISRQRVYRLLEGRDRAALLDNTTPDPARKPSAK